MPEIFSSKNAEVSRVDDSDITDTHSVDSATELTVDDDMASTDRKKEKRFRHADEYSEVMRYETPSRNPFDSFAAKPEGTFFDSQGQEEQVLLLLRRHPVTQLHWLVSAFLLLFFPLLLGYLPVGQLFSGLQLLAFLVLWYLIVTGFILESFLSWFFNVFIITDERVIDVDFLSLIYKNVSAAKIDHIEDITATTGGALRSIFDFGDVIIQTAGAQQEIEFEDVPHPAKVTKLLNELLLEEEREKIEGRVY